MSYETLKWEGELASVQDQIEKLKRAYSQLVSPWTVEYATIYLKLLERKEEGLTALLLWVESNGPSKKAKGLDYDRALYLDAQRWAEETPDWWRALDDLKARMFATNKAGEAAAELKDKPREANKSADVVVVKPKEKRGRKPDAFKQKRWKLMQDLYRRQPQIGGKRFWKAVESDGGRPNFAWTQRLINPCPKTLTQAFDDVNWNKALSDDKTRATKKLRK